MEKSMKLKELNKQERPHEKMIARGANALTDGELLAILLRTGTARSNVVDVARDLLRSADDRLGEVGAMSLEKIRQVDGIGPSKAVAVAAAFELGRRLSLEAGTENVTRMDSPAKVYRMMLPLLRDLDHEECWVIFLNRANYVLGKERISVGGMTSTVIDVKIVLRRALDHKASGVILVHNHPSGNAIPGEADIVQTRILKNALKTCEIQLVDHVVVAEDSWYSFADEQLVNEKF
jgi:DNA repair protein RadC